MEDKIVRQYRKCHCSTCHIHSETCHSRCKDYLRWKAEEDQVKRLAKKERDKNVFSNSARSAMIKNIKARQRRT